MPFSQPLAQTLQLPEILDLSYAAPLAESFLALRGMNLTVDAAGVQRVGAQCMQVILSAVSTWRIDEAEFSIIDPSPEFRDALSLLGVGLAEISIEEAMQ
jgi:chemotaxis protein CheX